MGNSGTMLKAACKRLLHNSRFTISSLVVLGATLGLAITIASVVEGTILRPLPFPDSGRIFQIREHLTGVAEPLDLTAPNLVTFQQPNPAFASVAGFIAANFEVNSAGSPLFVTGQRVSFSLFRVLGVQPMLGRAFTMKEDLDSMPVVILTAPLWRKHFNADPQVIGRTIDLNRVPHEVIGIMNDNFPFPIGATLAQQAEVLVPLSLTQNEKSSFVSFDFGALGKVNENVSKRQLDDAVSRVGHYIDSTIPPSANVHLSAFTSFPEENAIRSVRPALMLLSGAVLSLLFIAYINLGGVLLNRAIGQKAEIALRIALGATRGHLFGYFLFEAAIIALSSTILANWLAWTLLLKASALLPPSFPHFRTLSEDWRVLAAEVVLGGATALLFSVVPALVLLNTRSLKGMYDQKRGQSQSRSITHLRAVLAVSQLALTLVLMSGTGLLIRNYIHVAQTFPGFNPTEVTVARVALPGSVYGDLQAQQFYGKLGDLLSESYLRRTVALTSDLPISGENVQRAFVPEGFVPRGGNTFALTSNYVVSATYFSALGIQLLAGTTFSSSDQTATARRSVVINEALAKQYWPNQSPVGRRIKWGGSASTQGEWVTILGVVANTVQSTRDQLGAPQAYEPLGNDSSPRVIYVVSKSSEPYSAAAQNLQKAVHSLDPRLAIDHVESLDHVLARGSAANLFNIDVILVFAFLAGILSALGVYTVVSYGVTQRESEIAIRLALGCSRRAILQMFLLSGVRMASAGILIGGVSCLPLALVLKSSLFGITATGPSVILPAAVITMVIGISAALIPAFRAATKLPHSLLKSY